MKPVRFRARPWSLPSWRMAVSLRGPLITLVVMSLVATPAVAHAASLADLDSFKDEAKYSMFITLAELLWFVDKLLLLGAHQLELWRDWMMTSLLSPVFEATIAGIRFPFWLAATLAWVVFTITQSVKPVFGRSFINLQRSLGVLALALFVFHNATQILPPLERTQRGVAQEFGRMARAGVARAHITVPISTRDGALRQPGSIYAEESCEGLQLARRRPNGSLDGSLYLNDLAATYLWATAKDIHCPAQAGGRPRLPLAYVTSSGGGGSWGEESADGDPGYFVTSESELQDQTAEQRAAIVAWGWQGVMRLLCGLLICLIAGIEQGIYFVLALALFAAVVSVVFGLLLGLFQPGVVETRLKLVVKVFWTSATASFWLGLISAVLLLVAEVSHSAMMLLLMTAITGKFTWDQSKIVLGVCSETLTTSIRAGAGGALVPVAIGQKVMEGAGNLWKERRQERKEQKRWEKREQMREERRKAEEGEGASSTTPSTSAPARSTARGTGAASVPPPFAAAPPPRDWAWYESRIYAGSTQTANDEATPRQADSDAGNAAPEQVWRGRPMSERTTEPYPVVTSTTPQTQEATATEVAGSRGTSRRSRVYTAPGSAEQIEKPHPTATGDDRPRDEAHQARPSERPAPPRPVHQQPETTGHDSQTAGSNRVTEQVEPPRGATTRPVVSDDHAPAPAPKRSREPMPRRKAEGERPPSREASPPVAASGRGAETTPSPTATLDAPMAVAPRSSAVAVDDRPAPEPTSPAPSPVIVPVPPKRRPRPGLRSSRVTARQTPDVEEGVIS